MICLSKKLRDGSSVEMTLSDEKLAAVLLKDSRYSRVSAVEKAEKPAKVQEKEKAEKPAKAVENEQTQA